MKLDSKWFDRIRIHRREKPPVEERQPRCEAPGCRQPAPHRAPKGRMHEGEYFRFCLDHVREYNRSYNWFNGMSDADIAAWQASRVTGHRPTWSIGQNSHPGGRGRGARDGLGPDSVNDPFGFFHEGDFGGAATTERRRVGNAERKSLDALGLDETATGPEIKSRYKQLVKRHHPDANGGDRSKEGRLRQIIEAYAMLKASGFYPDCDAHWRRARLVTKVRPASRHRNTGQVGAGGRSAKLEKA